MEPDTPSDEVSRPLVCREPTTVAFFITLSVPVSKEPSDPSPSKAPKTKEAARRAPPTVSVPSTVALAATESVSPTVTVCVTIS